MGTLHLIEGTQAPEKETVVRKKAKILEQGVRVEARPLRRMKICNVNLSMKGVGLQNILQSHLETKVPHDGNIFL